MLYTMYRRVDYLEVQKMVTSLQDTRRQNDFFSTLPSRQQKEDKPINTAIQRMTPNPSACDC